ncbi:MAG TPA: mismatch-specific DNA-glycosylase [Chloroflexota bacterium]|nr:mismatch-specific DNA-glycosylase [Chloroflexota bacterium]
MTDSEERYAFATLPDLMKPEMRLVFVGINPSVISVEQGHYFARKTNRFWPAFSRSRLSAAIREALGVETLGPEHDRVLLEHGIGFTDVVKVPSSNASAVTPAMFREWAPRLLARLERHRPEVACFQGLMGFRPFLRFGLGRGDLTPELGVQPVTLGGTKLFVVPNPSPANAHFTPAQQTEWYDRLAI